jgi:hypothetical protein
VAVDGEVALLGEADFVEEVGVLSEDGVDVHDFGQEMEGGVVEEFADVLGGDGEGAVFKGGGGDAWGDAEPEIERQSVAVLRHEVKSVDTGDVGYFVRVGTDGEGAV